jgi:ATP-dependent exoDNAse (exonuclease V) beta subunit
VSDQPVVSQLPPATIPVVDPQTGLMPLVWRRFFETQWKRSGGFTDDVWVGLFLSSAYQVQINQLSQVVEELQADLAEARLAINSQSNDDRFEELRLQILTVQQQTSEGNLQLQTAIEENDQQAGQLQAQLLAGGAQNAAAKQQLEQQYAQVSGEVSGLTTDQVPEGLTNQYFTTARTRGAVSAVGSLSFNMSTGVFSYTQPTNVSAFTNDAKYTVAGTYTASPLAPVTGYVTMLDNTGAPRNFAIV